MVLVTIFRLLILNDGSQGSKINFIGVHGYYFVRL